MGDDPIAEWSVTCVRPAVFVVGESHYYDTSLSYMSFPPVWDMTDAMSTVPVDEQRDSVLHKDIIYCHIGCLWPGTPTCFMWKNSEPHCFALAIHTATNRCQ